MNVMTTEMRGSSQTQLQITCPQWQVSEAGHKDGVAIQRTDVHGMDAVVTHSTS
jgi:hypothetical protein